MKRGKPNHPLMMGSKFLFDAIIQKGYSLYIGDLPFLVKEDNGLGCEAEVYEVNTTDLMFLDQLEGHPDIYKRTKLFITNQKTGETDEAFVYVFQLGVDRRGGAHRVY